MRWRFTHYPDRRAYPTAMRQTGWRRAKRLSRHPNSGLTGTAAQCNYCFGDEWRLTDLEDQTFGLELHALLRQGLLEVVDLHDAKVIGLDGSLQGNGGFAHGFVGG